MRNFGSFAALYLLFVVALLVCAVVIVIGWIAGLIGAVLLTVALFAPVDRNPGLVESCRISIGVVRKNLGFTLLLWMLCGLAFVLTFFTAGLAVLAVVPCLTMVAAELYRQSSAARSAAEEFPAYPPQPHYPGPWG